MADQLSKDSWLLISYPINCLQPSIHYPITPEVDRFSMAVCNLFLRSFWTSLHVTTLESERSSIGESGAVVGLVVRVARYVRQLAIDDFMPITQALFRFIRL
jgi:hypothetical protein